MCMNENPKSDLTWGKDQGLTIEIDCSGRIQSEETSLMSEKPIVVILEDLRSNDLVCSFCGMKTVPKNIIIHICTDYRRWVTYWSYLYYSCTTAPFLRYLKACICNIQKKKKKLLLLLLYKENSKDQLLKQEAIC